MPRDEGPAASLASYQLEVLRDKNRELSRRLHGVRQRAGQRAFAVRTHQLTLALMRQGSAVRHRCARWRRAPPRIPWRPGADRAVRAGRRARPPTGCRSFPPATRARAVQGLFADGEALSGRLQLEKHALLYGDRGEEVQSSALLPMPGVGLVAVGSRDANRFYPGMGTLFLRMMAESLAVALQRFDG